MKLLIEKRKDFFFLIFASVIITLMSLLVFILPVQSGEKVSLSITIVLSYTVLMLVVSDVTPRSGDGQPCLGKLCSKFFAMASQFLFGVALHNIPKMVQVLSRIIGL